MKFYCIASTALLLLTACGREKPGQEQEVNSPKSVEASPVQPPAPDMRSHDVTTVPPQIGGTEPKSSNPDELLKEAGALILTKNGGGKMDKDALARLKAMIPRLRESGALWTVIEMIPTEQRSEFRDTIYESLRSLAPKPGQAIDPEYKSAFETAEFRKDPEVARIALEQLPLVPPYQFPETPLPADWPNARNLVHFTHGYQGMLASMVVLYGDEATMDAYRKALLSAPPGLQRVMVWALGRSAEQPDFDLLMTVQKDAIDAGMRDTATRALNRMISSMRSVAASPEIVSEVRRPSDPPALLKTAAQDEVLLKAKNLTVQLTVYD
jgi:hypothetical protein